MDDNMEGRGDQRGRGVNVRVRGGGRGGGGGGGGGGRVRLRRRAVISDEIRATVVDHVLNHGLTMQEAGQRVQPNIHIPNIQHTFLSRWGAECTLMRNKINFFDFSKWLQ